MWILLGAIIIIVSVGGLASLRNPTKLIDRIKGLIAPEEPEERAKKIIMKFGMAMAIIMGIWTYMNTWGIDLFGNMPSGILLSAVAWTYDELDDLWRWLRKISKKKSTKGQQNA